MNQNDNRYVYLKIIEVYRNYGTPLLFLNKHIYYRFDSLLKYFLNIFNH